jgi:hypothetical protein
LPALNEKKGGLSAALFLWGYPPLILEAYRKAGGAAASHKIAQRFYRLTDRQTIANSRGLSFSSGLPAARNFVAM